MTQEHISADLQETYPALHALKAKLEKALRQIGKSYQADALHGCHESFKGFRCRPNDHQFARPVNSCQFKLCPFDAKAERGRLIARFRRAMQERNVLRPRFTTLTIRNVADLGEGLKKLSKSFERLRHRRIWREGVRGWLARVEVTWNANDRTWHPHLHILYDGEYIPQAWLSKQWEKCCGGQGDVVVDIREVLLEKLSEVIKYCTKVTDFADDAEVVAVFLRVTAGVRFTRTGGAFFKLDRVLEVCDRCPERKHFWIRFIALDGERDLGCPDCGSLDVETVGRVWAEQLWFDVDGVMRYDSEQNSTPIVRAGPDAVISEESFNLSYEHPRLFADAAD